MCEDSWFYSHPVVKDVSSLDEVVLRFNPMAYQKGGTVLKMLQHVLDEDLRQILSIYVKKYAYRNAKTSDFWAECTTKHNLSELMDTWLHNTGFPFIELKRNAETMTVTQSRFLRPLLDSKFDRKTILDKFKPFQIPVTYKNMNTGIKSTFWLTEMNATFQINASDGDVVKFNPGFDEYFIVNYDPLDWGLLGRTLLQNHQIFNVTDRFNLLYDAFSLAELGRLNYHVPLEMTKYLKGENQSLPWNFFRDRYLYLMRRLGVESKTGELLKAYVRQLTSKLYDDYVSPMKSKSSFKKWERTKIIQDCTSGPHLDFLFVIIDLACRTSNTKCLDSMQEELELWLNDQNIESDIRLVLELTVSNFGSSSLWEHLYAKLISNDTIKENKRLIAESLFYFNDPILFNKTIDSILFDSKIDQDLSILMIDALSREPTVLMHLWRYAQNNWNECPIRSDPDIKDDYRIPMLCKKFESEEEGLLNGLKSWKDKHEETLAIWLMFN